MATPAEFLAFRMNLEKECFDRVAVLQTSVYTDDCNLILPTAALVGFVCYFQSAMRMPSSLSPGERLRICATLSLKRLLNARPYLYRSSAFYITFLVSSLCTLYKWLDYYYTSLIMDSKYRFILMLEEDEFRRRLIQVYGARGLALARVSDPSGDDELDELARLVAFAGHEEPPKVHYSYQVKFGEGVLIVDQHEHGTSELPCWFDNEDELQKLIDIRLLTSIIVVPFTGSPSPKLEQKISTPVSKEIIRKTNTKEKEDEQYIRLASHALSEAENGRKRAFENIQASLTSWQNLVTAINEQYFLELLQSTKGPWLILQEIRNFWPKY